MRRLVFVVDLKEDEPLPPPDTRAEVAYKVDDQWYWVDGRLSEVLEVEDDG